MSLDMIIDVIKGVKIMKQKYYYISTVAVLMAGLLTGCGNAEEGTDTTEQPESTITESEAESVPDPEDDVAAVCEMMRAMDFTVEQPHMELTEEDRAYKEAYLRLLKNELPIKGWTEEYYQDLWWAGIPYGDLLEERDNIGSYNSYYYNDIDGDGKPEFGLTQGCVYFFDYELGDDACSISYHAERTYFKKLLGVGRIWEQDVVHAGVERNRYIVLNSDGEWEPVIDLQYFSGGEQDFYVINRVDVGKENWEELTPPFFEATEHEVPAKTLREVFGELLDADWHRSVETRKEIFELEREKVDEDVPHFLVRAEFPQLESTSYPAAIEQANASLRDSAFELFGSSYEEAVAQFTELEHDLSVYKDIWISYDILKVTEDEFHILFVVESFYHSVYEYVEEYQITINLKTGERIIVHAEVPDEQ